MKLNLESLIIELNDKGKYQYLVLAIICLITIGNSFVYEMTPLMVSKPKVTYEGNAKAVSLDYDICKKNYKIVDEVDNWTKQFSIQCDQFLTSFLQQSLLVGNVIGLIVLKFFPYSKEFFYKLTQIIYTFSFLLVFVDNIYVISIMNFLQGFSYFSSFIIKNMIITEITSKKSRSFFFSFVYFTRMVIPFINPLLYGVINDIGWKNLYLIIGGFQFVVTAILIFYLKTNPGYFILNNQKDDAFQSALFIGKANGKIIENHIDDNNLSNKVGKINEDSQYNEELDDLTNNNNNLLIEVEDGYVGKSAKSSKSTKSNKTYKSSGVIYSPDTFRLWLNENFFLDSDEENQDIDNIDHVHDDKIKYFTLKNLIFTVLMSSFSMSFFTGNFEKKIYSTEMNFKLIYMISIGVSTSLIMPTAYFQDTKLGRKGILIILFSFAMIVRIISLCIYGRTVIIPFFIIYGINYLPTSVFHVFVTESFTNRERVTIYSILSVISKIIVIAIPYILEYLPELVYNLMNIGYNIVFLIVILFTDETRGKRLLD